MICDTQASKATSKQCIFFHFRKSSVSWEEKHQDQKKVDADLWIRNILVLLNFFFFFWDNGFLLSSAAMEALGMDLYKRNKPEKLPFAHLIIDDKNIPSGKFSFKWMLLMLLWMCSTHYLRCTCYFSALYNQTKREFSEAWNLRFCQPALFRDKSRLHMRG